MINAENADVSHPKHGCLSSVHVVTLSLIFKTSWFNTCKLPYENENNCWTDCESTYIVIWSESLQNKRNRKMFWLDVLNLKNALLHKIVLFQSVDLICIIAMGICRFVYLAMTSLLLIFCVASACTCCVCVWKSNTVPGFLFVLSN